MVNQKAWAEEEKGFILSLLLFILGNISNLIELEVTQLRQQKKYKSQIRQSGERLNQMIDTNVNDLE